MTYFSSPKTRDQGFILNSQRSLRMTQQMLSSDLLDVINHLIRASKDSREKVLDWFAAALNLNHKRRAMQVDPKTVSSDGFMFNITTCLDQLCEPFMDAAFTKVWLFPCSFRFTADQSRSIALMPITCIATPECSCGTKQRSMLINMRLTSSMPRQWTERRISSPRFSS